MYATLLLLWILAGQESPTQIATAAPELPGIEQCLICHGKPKITELSSPARRALLRKDPADADVPLKSDDPAFRQKLFVDLYTYLDSAHGKLKCVECHKDVTLPSHRPGRAAVDCKPCHEQPWADYHASDHFKAFQEKVEDAPYCYDCHGNWHTMLARTDPRAPVNPAHVVYTCGACHPSQFETYKRTYHGLFFLHGNLDAARCMSCHENHRVLKAADPLSSVNPSRLADTCRKCHTDAPDAFAAFRPHLNPLEEKQCGALFALAWFMRILLVGILAFFGVHSLLWFFRSLPDFLFRVRRSPEDRGLAVLRFSALHRTVHFLIILSFLGLCGSGLSLSFADQDWAKEIVRSLGGLAGARHLHRTCAGVTAIYAILHLVHLARRMAANRKAGRGLLSFGADSLLPRRKDFTDLLDQFRWFFGKGPRPRFGRFSYMEKFDYWAVFWGVATLGMSGLILWFPEFFTRFIPGWSLNAAKIVHSEEAVLAAAYIFAIHFFNVHLRPLKFPADPVMFTGREPLAHLKRERAEQAAGLEAEEAALSVVKGPGLAWRAASILLALCLLAAGLGLLYLLVSGWIAGASA